MPVYTYQCESCGVRFERSQKFTDSPLTWCPECGKKALRKVYTPVGIVFKGSGFYATDHKSPSGGKGVGGKAGEKESEGEKPTTEAKSSSESKPVESKPSGEPKSSE